MVLHHVRPGQRAWEELFDLSPDWTYLNHGSYGATLRCGLLVYSSLKAFYAVESCAPLAQVMQHGTHQRCMNLPELATAMCCMLQIRIRGAVVVPGAGGATACPFHGDAGTACPQGACNHKLPACCLTIADARIAAARTLGAFSAGFLTAILQQIVQAMLWEQRQLSGVWGMRRLRGRTWPP